MVAPSSDAGRSGWGDGFEARSSPDDGGSGWGDGFQASSDLAEELGGEDDAYTMAQASALAYEGQDLDGKAREMGFDSAQAFETGDKSLRAVMLTKGDDTIVAFRGTDNVANMASDMNIQQNCFDDNPAAGSVHAGFKEALQKLDQETGILEEMQEKADDQGGDLLLAGHSMGGDMAVLAGAKVAEEGAASPDGIYTFGTPDAGNRQFADYYDNQLGLGDETHRYATEGDPVPAASALANTWLHTDYAPVGDSTVLGRDGSVREGAEPNWQVDPFQADQHSMYRYLDGLQKD